ncbi:hypothetical protein A9B99_06270 [Mangrovibacter phragmitis]|uniref:Flagellar biosynthesis protein FlgN n=1 Tax=Mangrovibacter phragmitis TaxID=1691903 RepID=A0A1B7L3J7_9ENTR|nr:flagellar protein FlgN [Mangrovibacter phragmitis]OAT76917.1 hypothetical protein A9B99_06270 [Mangrovibacter phragmitis]
MNNQARQYLQQFMYDLSQDYKAWRGLNALLLRQRQAILARNSEELETINQQIFGLYHKLSSTGNTRQKLLSALGISTNHQGVQRLIRHLPPAWQERGRALWQQVETQAREAQTANQYNGTLLNMQYDIVQSILNASEPENWLYQHR